MPSVEQRTVVSADGTTISYLEQGEGPALVLLHGAMQSARNFSQLAAALSSSFRVCVPDRRGRGRSGPFGAAYCLAREAEDLDALLKKTGAHFVFGLSAGALIALHAARALPAIEKLAVYEPPLTIDGVDPAAWVPRYEREVDRGDLAAALVTILQGTGDVELLTYLPRLLLVPLLRLALRADAAQGGVDRIAIRDLIPTVRSDALLQREASTELATFADLRCEVLLMGGARSHRALRVGLDALARRMPQARLVRLARIGHLAADDVGRPQEVANELRAFWST
ncbi:MAG: alpha/beta hydrolase [Deltaproteobacteria bacterium]